VPARRAARVRRMRADSEAGSARRVHGRDGHDPLGV